MTELYTDYLISSFGQTTATGLSTMLNVGINHDKVTQFLAKEDMTSKQLWQLVKPTIRQIEQDNGVLIFDDTIQAKNHTQTNQTPFAGTTTIVATKTSKGLTYSTAYITLTTYPYP